MDVSGELNEAEHTGNITAQAWANPKGLETQLSLRIRKELRNKKDVESIKAFIKKPENRLMLAQWELLHRADLKALGTMMKDSAASRDLAPLLNDLPWVSSFVYDGEMEKPEVALAMVRHFRQIDPDMDKEEPEESAMADAPTAEGEAAGDGKKPVTNAQLKRRVAAAVAVEFTRNEWYGEQKPLTAKEIQEMREQGIMIPKARGKEKSDTYRLARERYLFFKESIDEELFNGRFRELPDWLLHYVCGWKGTNGFGSASTMRWLRDNVAAPSGNYTGMAYQVPYLPINMFGDSIHSAYYYQPYEKLYPGNFAKMSRDVGAVCGGLSHFGASSACANGVPAITMGEPGHCAYAVYDGDKWHACNSIGEEHHPHWKHWGEFGSWGALLMQTAMYKDGARTRDAQLVCTIASVLAEARDTADALDLYEMAAGMQPLYKPVLSQYIATATGALRHARKWLGVNKFICESVAGSHPEMCAKFLTEQIYPAMLSHVRSDRHKMQAFQDFFANLGKNDGGTWDIEALLDHQYKSLGRMQTRRMEYMEMVIDNGVKKPDFSQAISWAVRTSALENKRMGTKVLEKTLDLAASCPDKELMDSALIRAGEELGDTALVHKYSEPYINRKTVELPSFSRPAGNLVSAEGYVQVAEPFADQRIFASHMAALTENGGFIRSEPGKHQLMTLVLPKPTQLGCIIIIPKGGTKDYRDWKVEISADGKAWQTLQQLPDAQEQPLVRVDVSGKQKARFIRVDSGDKQETGIQFNAFLVYDNKKAR